MYPTWIEDTHKCERVTLELQEFKRMLENPTFKLWVIQKLGLFHWIYSEPSGIEACNNPNLKQNKLVILFLNFLRNIDFMPLGAPVYVSLATGIVCVGVMYSTLRNIQDLFTDFIKMQNNGCDNNELTQIKSELAQTKTKLAQIKTEIIQIKEKEFVERETEFTQHMKRLTEMV